MDKGSMRANRYRKDRCRMPIWVPIAKALINAGMAQKIPSIQRLMGEGLPFLKYYSKRILGSPNVELKATQAMLNDMPEDVVDLSLGAPDFEPGLFTNIALDESAVSGYPPVSGLMSLRKAIAKKLSIDNQVEVDPEHQILVCNGVSQGIGLMLDTFVDWGDRVVVFDPSFFIYRLAAQNRGARIVHVPSWIDGGRTRFEEDALRRALRKAKVLFVNSPANPTGGILSEDDLERIAYWCERHDVLIFSDEVYERFQYAGAHGSIARFPKAKERTITANGFSKSHGMAALRVGYLAGARYLIQPMIVSFLSTAPFVSVGAQQMALSAIERPPEDFQPIRAKYLARRNAVTSALTAAGLVHDLPAGAFYFWVPVRVFGVSGDEFARRLLAEEHVKIMPGTSAGPSGTEFVRISYAGDGQRLGEGLRRLRNFAHRLSPIQVHRMSRNPSAPTPTSPSLPLADRTIA